MTVTNTQYEEALQTVADKEQELLTDTKAVLASVLPEMQAAVDSLNQARNGLPTITGVTSNGRATLDNAYNQLQSFVTQLGYVVDSINSSLAQYTPATEQQPSS